MRVYKFGGASVKSAEAIRNLGEIINARPTGALVVVVSAMGKTTNALELLAKLWFERDPKFGEHWNTIRAFHQAIVEELFEVPQSPFDKLIAEIEMLLNTLPPHRFDQAYDSIVHFGELLSTTIVSLHLKSIGLEHRFLDARELIITDQQHREANVDWEASTLAIRKAMKEEVGDDKGVMLTQGFIGASHEGRPTTLGREGSDYTAAIFGSILGAEEVVIWKDVPGLLNADPKYFDETDLLSSISYREAIELAYYGATIIHPKTIKPLQNKQIPLKVKSFVSPEGEGSVISIQKEYDGLIPSFILKQNQVLLTLSPRDFRFMDERVLSDILKVFAEERIKLNMMQNSAISFSACFDFDESRFQSALERLTFDFRTKYNTGLQLITVRHYSEEVIQRLLEGKEVLLEQRSRLTAQFIAKPQ